MQIHLTDIQAIEGIGPAHAAELAKADVHVVADLLKVPTVRMLRKVRSARTARGIERWRCMAMLLELPVMTPNWAEVLVDAGIDTPEELMRADPARIDLAFKAASEKRCSSSLPDPRQKVSLQVEAAVLTHTGFVTGKVTDRRGRAIAGAVIQVQDRETTTNGRGGFRVSGVSLGTATRLVVRHADYIARIIRQPRIAVDGHSFSANRVKLFKRPADAVARVWRERDGDRLPPTSGLPIRTIRHPAEEIPAGDILLLRNETASGKLDAVSRFRSCIDGEVQVDVYRLDPTLLPANVSVRDHVTMTATGLRRIRITPARLEKEKRARQFEALKARMNITPDFAGLDRLIKARSGT